MLYLIHAANKCQKGYCFLTDGDTSEEVVDSLPLKHTSEIDHDDCSEKDKDNVLIQEDHISPSVSDKFDNSMPLI